MYEYVCEFMQVYIIKHTCVCICEEVMHFLILISMFIILPLLQQMLVMKTNILTNHLMH